MTRIDCTTSARLRRNTAAGGITRRRAPAQRLGHRSRRGRSRRGVHRQALRARLCALLQRGQIVIGRPQRRQIQRTHQRLIRRDQPQHTLARWRHLAGRPARQHRLRHTRQRLELDLGMTCVLQGLGNVLDGQHARSVCAWMRTNALPHNAAGCAPRALRDL